MKPNIHNLKDLKNAKIYIKDLDYLIKNSEQVIEHYSKFIKYKPVSRILAVLNTELSLMKIYRTNCEKIVKDKGLIKSE